MLRMKRLPPNSFRSEASGSPTVRLRADKLHGRLGGHEDQFPPRRPNAHYVIGKETLGGSAATGETRRFWPFKRQKSKAAADSSNSQMYLNTPIDPPGSNNLSSATSHKPWRRRRPSASPARCRSGGQF